MAPAGGICSAGGIGLAGGIDNGVGQELKPGHVGQAEIQQHTIELLCA